MSGNLEMPDGNLCMCASWLCMCGLAKQQLGIVLKRGNVHAMRQAGYEMHILVYYRFSHISCGV